MIYDPAIKKNVRQVLGYFSILINLWMLQPLFCLAVYCIHDSFYNFISTGYIIFYRGSIFIFITAIMLLINIGFILWNKSIAGLRPPRQHIWFLFFLCGNIFILFTGAYYYIWSTCNWQNSLRIIITPIPSMLFFAKESWNSWNYFYRRYITPTKE